MEYKTCFKQINHRTLEVFVETPDKITFGLQLNARGNPSPDQILDLFKNNFKDFFIETEMLLTEEVIIPQKTKEEEIREILVEEKKEEPTII